MKVLLAIDGTVESDLAEAVLCSVADPESTEISVVHVIDDLMPEVLLKGLVEEDAEAEREAHKAARQVAERTLDTIVKRLKTLGFSGKAYILTGAPGDAIMETVKSDQPDLVVVGSGGKNSLQALFLGSVSRKLVLYSESSVLIGRLPRSGKIEEDAPAKTLSKPLTVLVAVDGQAGSDLALETLGALPKPIFDQAYTLSVEPISALPMGVDTFFYARMFEEGLEACRHLAQTAADRIKGCAERVTPLTEIGRPSHVIAKKAEEVGADLIVMGASRHGKFERFLLGSCAYETANLAPCSVLILRDVLSLASSDHLKEKAEA